MTPDPTLTDEELAGIEREFRGTGEQRADVCSMCPKGWPLIAEVPKQYNGDASYVLHIHLAPWDDGRADEDFDHFDPRPSVRRLIAALHAARAEVERLSARTVAETMADLLDQLDAKTAEAVSLTREVERRAAAEVEHDEPNCDPAVDCKFVGPRDCPCRCHSVASEAENERPSDDAIAEQQRMTTAYYADPDV
jgi:hypothetical protein